MRRLLIAAILTLLAAYGCSGGKPEDEKMLAERFNMELKEGAPATDFQYTDMRNNVFRLSKEKGNVVLLYFWRMKCKECLDELEAIEAVHRKYKDRGLKVVAVGADTMHSAPVIKVAELFSKHGYTFTAIRDSEGFVSEAFNVMRAPEAYLIDKNGNIARIVKGKPGDWAGPEKTRLIESLL